MRRTEGAAAARERAGSCSEVDPPSPPKRSSRPASISTASAHARARMRAPSASLSSACAERVERLTHGGAGPRGAGARRAAVCVAWAPPRPLPPSACMASTLSKRPRGSGRRDAHRKPLDRLQHRVPEQRAAGGEHPPRALKVRRQTNHVLHRERHLGQIRTLGKRPQTHAHHRLRAAEHARAFPDDDVRVVRVVDDSRADVSGEEDEPTDPVLLLPP